MKLAIWNTPAAEFFLSGLTSGAVITDLEVERKSPRACVSLLERGDVDVALVPVIAALKDEDHYDLIPGAALSTWKYPFARVVLKHGLSEPIQTVAFDPVYANEAVITRVVLREHYGSEASFVPYPSPTVDQLLHAKEDASLIVGMDSLLVRTERYSLDLGQEWYELSNYPMVWGLFAARKGTGTPDMVHALRALAESADEHRSMWMQAQEMPPVLHEFFTDDLRVRLDDLAMASLTELCHQLFYIDVIDQIPDLPFITLPDDEEGKESDE